ncbi:DUF5317 domain-containing protein [Candidatus Oleimmundimicrobium sp.]|uniref:DUF5317 domain-containing protein n=1 Tax=Candidatus Oleimmundimicrobium sp. TaxID=3060597 RepID=UPI00280AC068|nr:DUF5317 domain-containing protein [Candidatus Oleimmundimicrobium sp.]
MLSIFIGWLRGGSLRRFADWNFRLPWVFIVAFLLQFFLPQIASVFNLGKNFAFFILVFSYILLMEGIILNLKNKYFPVLGLGILLNFLVITLNRGMPVSLETVAKYGSPEAALKIKQSFDFIHISMGNETLLKFLADIIPVPTLLPLGMSLVSVGDLFISLGIFLVVQKQMVYIGKRRMKKAAPQGH